MIHDDTYLSIRQLTELLGRSRDQIHSLIHEGHLPGYRTPPLGMIWVRAGDAREVFPLRFPPGVEVPAEKHQPPRVLERMETK